MDFLHLRCFLTVAEELHIEQSPLSRAIKNLEEDSAIVFRANNVRGLLDKCLTAPCV